MGTTDSNAAGIDYFNRGHPLTRLQIRVSLQARRRMYECWRRFVGSGKVGSVLDVGTTPDRERADSNCMIPWLQDVADSVTLYSPEPLDGLDRAFPGTQVLGAGGFGNPIPAAARQFDWAVSSAVLEHVGNAEQQCEFIRDSARVADGLFLTTPNRGHWLEFHTKLPLAHWLPRPAHRAVLSKLGMKTWAQESHLRLVGARELRALAEEALAGAFDYRIEKVWSLGMPSNLVLLARRK